MKKNKNKSIYVCQACGSQSLKWLGRCPDCQAWNTMVEEFSGPVRSRGGFQPGDTLPDMVQIGKVETSRSAYQSTHIKELDNVLGGGIVAGALVLVGGDPGIGKSTLLLQMAYQLAKNGKKVCYISGEESAGQIKLRADRLGALSDRLFLVCETQVARIEGLAQSEQPDVMIIDSIQTLHHPDITSVPGSVAQIRESGGAMMKLAKSNGPVIFLVGHVTKDGQLAGPRIIEHMVDTVLYFEGDKQHGYRILRTIKNRFGSTNEVGLFEMTSNGLAEIDDPSQLFISERQPDAAGSCIGASLEGTRPLLVEVQALVATAYFGMPQRRVSGLDYNRACLMLAVLEKRAGLSLGAQDVFLSIAGGLTVLEPALDLPITAAVASSLKEKAIQSETACFGEIGLGGEIRAVTQPERRLSEIEKMGFKSCVCPEKNLQQLKSKFKIKLIGALSLTEALAALFE